MKKAGKSSDYEPTLSDVLEAVQTGFAKVEDRFDGVETRLDKVEGRLDGVETRLDKVEGRLDGVETRLIKVENRLAGVEQGLEETSYRVTALERRMGSLEEITEEMKETLDGVARAIDKDSVTLIDHTRRIAQLEKA